MNSSDEHLPIPPDTSKLDSQDAAIRFRKIAEDIQQTKAVIRVFKTEFPFLTIRPKDQT